jgi:hypothetical protein
MMSSPEAYELARQHRRYHQDNQDESCVMCAFEREKNTLDVAIGTRVRVMSLPGEHFVIRAFDHEDDVLSIRLRREP